MSVCLCLTKVCGAGTRLFVIIVRSNFIFFGISFAVGVALSETRTGLVWQGLWEDACARDLLLRACSAALPLPWRLQGS